MDFNPKVSFFRHKKTSTPSPSVPTLMVILGNIQSGTFALQIEAIRQARSKAEKDGIKDKLPGWTFSGTFKKRNSAPESLIEYTHIICQDIDNLTPTQLKNLKEKLSGCAYVFSCFISPSGNGLKVLFRVSTGASDHERAFNAITSYLNQNFSIAANNDTKCKDICRLCFVSYDPDIYINTDASIIDEGFIEKNSQLIIVLPQDTAVVPNVSTQSDNELIAKCHEITQRTQTASSGNYNSYINIFCLQANRYAIPEVDCLSEMLSYCSQHDPKDTKAVVRNVYKRMYAENGDYLKKKIPEVQPETTIVYPGTDSEPKYDETEKFWYTVDKIDAKGNKKGVEYKYSYNRGIEFLKNNGFFKYRIDKDKYQLIHVNLRHKIVDIINELRVKEFFFDYLSENKDEEEYWHVLEMFRRGVKNYCGTAILEGLPYYYPDLQRDSATTAYVYFKDCFIVVTKDGITLKPYTEQEGYVWEKQIINAKFKLIDEVSEFERYLWYAITGNKYKAYKEYTELDQKKILSVRTSIGYMLHQYKNPACAKAVISVDKKQRTMGEPNGRSGKSLLAKGISRMINQCYIDGPRFKFEYDFAFQDVSADTQFINFNDVPKNFSFDRLFGMITEEFTYNKKKMDGIVIPFALSPKFYISTNYSLRGDGESNRGRQQIIEFSDYFTSQHTPAIEFGHMFFSDWSDDEWCRFYNFMIGCIRLYLEHNLIDFPLENYGLNKLIDTAGDEFVDYMNEVVTELNAYGQRLELKPMYETYISKHRHHEKVKQHTFTKWMNMWAGVNELLINAHTKGERDRSNGRDYITFTHLAAQPESAMHSGIPKTLPF